MAEITIELPTLHADQIKAFRVWQQNRFVAVRCGRRWGKTALGVTVASDGVIKGESVGIFAPDYKILSETYHDIVRMLNPVISTASQTAGVIRATTGGRVDFWTLENERAGRSRKYHKVIFDEAAFGKANVMDIWQKSIKPTLLDYGGKCLALSNSAGADPENFLWRICNEPEHGFIDFHAPTRNNPHLPAAEVAKLRNENTPLVYAQEYEAEFVDWSGASFFTLDSMLVDGKPAEDPARTDAVFAIIDSAAKAGTEHDGTAVTYFARNKLGAGAPLTIIDWDIIQIEGAMLDVWLPTVFERLEELSRVMRSRSGSLGVWIEDKATGIVLNQKARINGWPAQPIDSKFTSIGKDERAIAVSGHFHQGKVKISRSAYEKVKIFKGVSRNHLIHQVCAFRIGDKDAYKRADDLLDCVVYGAALALGNNEGF